jgi:hypothetical protein
LGRARKLRKARKLRWSTGQGPCRACLLDGHGFARLAEKHGDLEQHVRLLGIGPGLRPLLQLEIPKFRRSQLRD